MSGGEAIPITGGGRVTGKVGRLGFGVMSLQTDDVEGVTPGTNFSVVRVKQDVLRRSSIGALFTNRSKSVVADGTLTAGDFTTTVLGLLVPTSHSRR